MWRAQGSFRVIALSANTPPRFGKWKHAQYARNKIKDGRGERNDELTARGQTGSKADADRRGSPGEGLVRTPSRLLGSQPAIPLPHQQTPRLALARRMHRNSPPSHHATRPR